MSNSLQDSKSEAKKSFAELGICSELCKIITERGWPTPTEIQEQAIPIALSGRDIVGLAETGSGKTGAFALPILNDLLQNQRKAPCAVIVSPTRELAVQIGNEFEELGRKIGLRCVIILGGVDIREQIPLLSSKPHVIVATPGRLVDHLKGTKGFSIKTARFLVLDEADQLLKRDFQDAVDTIVQSCQRERITFLFSATMTEKVSKLERVCLRNAMRITIGSKFRTVATLMQRVVIVPLVEKSVHLVALLLQLEGKSIIIFTRTCQLAQKIAVMLKLLNFSVEALYGSLDQMQRIQALNRFRKNARKILVATDVASRGLDIPHVDAVIIYDLPDSAKIYMHRVGRTARAGRGGLAYTFVTQYDTEMFMRIEGAIGSALKDENEKQVKKKNQDKLEQSQRIDKLKDKTDIIEKDDQKNDLNNCEENDEIFQFTSKPVKRKRKQEEEEEYDNDEDQSDENEVISNSDSEDRNVDRIDENQSIQKKTISESEKEIDQKNQQFEEFKENISSEEFKMQEQTFSKEEIKSIWDSVKKAESLADAELKESGKKGKHKKRGLDLLADIKPDAGEQYEEEEEYINGRDGIEEDESISQVAKEGKKGKRFGKGRNQSGGNRREGKKQGQGWKQNNRKRMRH
ncbi:MAG: putative ATP-dependent rRNA helicase RRP3 [Streblomastix strix]|uniref:Putative ATP-dependent rRNA helicase RRP3 n=1 Tax=Streblomastix strix TaxID=222440 RepID=A0A5J4UZG0_9EUKA|nr:MAG: putative ATP-dependent rRNA helicase RRP3 [Streblomastix strix]